MTPNALVKMLGLAAVAGLFAATTLVPSSLHAAQQPQHQSAGVAAPHTPFTTILMKHWEHWDANHDGTLSVEEITKAVADPALKGDDAAAAASLKLLSRGSKNPLPALTKSYFEAYEAAAAKLPAPEVTKAEKPGDTEIDPGMRSTRMAVDWDASFTGAKKRLARASEGADILTHGWPKEFSVDCVRQGPLGDCFFVATVGSMAVHRPSALAKLVERQSDGKFKVSLPSTQPIIVNAPTDAELAISGTVSGGGGPWLAVLEQAFGRYRSLAKGGSDQVEGTDILRTGGDSSPTISALTGHATHRITFPKTATLRKEKATEMLPEIRKALESAMADGRIVTAGVNPPSTGDDLPKIPPAILKKHVYAVVSYDPKSDVIEIWNPHGQLFAPKGASGLENGYATEHGRFKLPLMEAYSFYTSFTFETNEPVKNK